MASTVTTKTNIPDVFTMLYFVPRTRGAIDVVQHPANASFVMKNPSFIDGGQGPKYVLRFGLDSPIKNARQGLIFGRGNNDAVDISMDIGDPRISSKHFRIHIDEKSYFLHLVCESKNGVEVNRAQIFDKSQRVLVGQIIGFASVMFELSELVRSPSEIEKMRKKIMSYVDKVNYELVIKTAGYLGPFIIAGEQDGGGSSGIVYRVFKRNSKVLFAAKQIEARSAEKAIKEILHLSNFRHSRVIRYHEWLIPIPQFGPNPWIIMEYVTHGTLLQYCQNHILYPTQINQVLHQVLLALRYIHSKGIIHGRISPKSILVESFDPPGKSISIKVSDFGMSTQNLGGIWGYTAPEMMQEKPFRTNAIDIWATGVVAKNAVLEFQETSSRPNCPSEARFPGEKVLKLMVDNDPAKRPSAETCLEFPFFSIPNEDWKEILRMFQRDWFINFSPWQLKLQLKVAEASAQEAFSAPFKFYQNRLVERYNTENYELKYTLQEYQSDSNKYRQDASKLMNDLLEFPPAERNSMALTLLILLDRMPYHPGHLSKSLMLHFKNLSCALALTLLNPSNSNGNKHERIDYHSEFRCRPELRSWFYTPLLFSGNQSLTKSAQFYFKEMKEDTKELGNEGADMFINTFKGLYEDARVASMIKGKARKTVLFSPMVQKRSDEDGHDSLEPLSMKPSKNYFPKRPKGGVQV